MNFSIGSYCFLNAASNPCYVIETKDRDSSWILQGMSTDFILGALQNPSVTAKNAPPERFLNAASNPCYEVGEKSKRTSATSFLILRKDRDSVSRLDGARSSAALDCPPDSQFTTAPLRIPVFLFAAKKDAFWRPLCGGKTGIRTLEAVLALTRFPVVRLRPTQPSFHSRLLMLLFTCGCSIPYFYQKIKCFLKKTEKI